MRWLAALLLAWCATGCGGETLDSSGRSAGEPPATSGPTEHLEFFNGLSGTLKITLSKPPKKIAPNLENEKAAPSAKIESVELEFERYEDEAFHPLTEEEWGRVVLRDREVRIAGEAGIPVKHVAPTAEGFTVRDLAAAIAETERQTRGKTEWFGGIDIHHVFFEGMQLQDDGVWYVPWGS